LEADKIESLKLCRLIWLDNSKSVFTLDILHTETQIMLMLEMTLRCVTS